MTALTYGATLLAIMVTTTLFTISLTSGEFELALLHLILTALGFSLLTYIARDRITPTDEE